MANKSTSRGRAATTKSTAGRKSQSRGGDTPFSFAGNWGERSGVRVLAALIVGVVVGMLASSGLQKVVADQPEAPSWQYGRLHVAPSGATWSAPHREHSAAGLEDLYRKLGGTQRHASVTPAEMVSLIGDRSWELISVSYGDRRNGDNYWFRRPS
jgi:hypothetical protein